MVIKLTGMIWAGRVESMGDENIVEKKLSCENMSEMERMEERNLFLEGMIILKWTVMK